VQLYTLSKAENWLLTPEFAISYKKGCIVSLEQDPGQQLDMKIWVGPPRVATYSMSLFNRPPKIGRLYGLLEWAGGGSGS